MDEAGLLVTVRIGVAIDILTGFIIDFELLSLYCHGCVEADNRDWSGGARERLLREEKHVPDCFKTYTGSSKATETEAAKRIWLRSVEKYNLRYTEVMSDGDITAFKALPDLQPYGDRRTTAAGFHMQNMLDILAKTLAYRSKYIHILNPTVREDIR